MLFNSYIFIFLFLPLTLIGYFTLARISKKYSQVFLIVMSLWFYGYFNFWYVFIIIGSILFNYLFSRILSKRPSKALLSLGIAANVLLIFYFKYLNFIKETINIVFGSDFVITNIVLPLGISFFTFQQISFVVDSFKGETKDYGFIEYALFVSFFPQLIAGPIVLHNELIPQFRDDEKRKLNIENLYSGIILFTLGLAKKVLLADTFARSVTWAFSGMIDDLRALELIIIMLSYTFQIYFDFSAYSDMAVGIGRMLNIVIPINFNSPYKALSIPDFWKRWHMTLTRFLRNYIYYPLGGNRKGQLRTYINIMIVFLVSGIWHGANWTFILWGILHGVANSLTRLFKDKYDKLHLAFQWFITFVYVNFLWLLFRADNIRQWIKMVLRIAKLEDLSVRKELFDCFSLPEKTFLVDVLHLSALYSKIPWLFMAVFFIMAFCICLNHKNNYEREINSSSLMLTCGAAVLFALSVISLGGVSVFIYFDF